MDEANTKAAVLRDFLDLLNWEIPTNTQLEYSVEAFGQTYKVDYALILEGTPVAFLEAKGADTTLTEKHDEQLSSYMTNKNVTYGILTNGKQYRFFQRRVDASNVDVQRIADVELTGLPNRRAVLRAFTKAAIESGESGKILGRINELREARRTLESKKEQLASGVAQNLADGVSETILPLAESQSKEMIDRLVADIDSEIDADGEPERVPSDTGDEDIKPMKDNVSGTIQRSDIEGKSDAKVAVFPTQVSGLPFLKENNAWGFVRVGSEFEYVAMYVTGEAKEVKYFATVDEIASPEEADLARPAMDYLDRDEIGDGKKVIQFKTGSLYELGDPIPFETKYPQSLRYTTLEKLRTAQTTDDLF
ncbi:type I restriction enzyme HsdR N-terminal domain-containing protein [Halorubrum gandharaense]